MTHQVVAICLTRAASEQALTRRPLDCHFKSLLRLGAPRSSVLTFFLVATARAMGDCKKVFLSTIKSTIAKVKEVALLGGLITSLLLCRRHCSKPGRGFKIKNKPFSSLPLPP